MASEFGYKTLVRRLLPSGTATSGAFPNWKQCPSWPPDLFGVAASIVLQSGCYVGARYTAPWSDSYFFDEAYRTRVRRSAKQWREKLKPPRVVHNLWKNLLSPASREKAHDAALELMAIADEVSVGMGFLGDEMTPFAEFVLSEHDMIVHKKPSALPYLPASLCVLMPPSEACVQPKARTPQVGCTLRSLSHNLALLPPIGDVRTRWMFGRSSTSTSEGPLNMLLVPFPYTVEGGCFVAQPETTVGGRSDSEPRYFTVEQRWLRSKRGRVTPEQIASLLISLIEQAEREVQQVHAVILPEGSLDSAGAPSVAEILARRTEVELFVAGVAVASSRRREPQNVVYSALLADQKILTSWIQSKHHRWRLDRSQICRYHVGDALDPNHLWWERIALGSEGHRECFFYNFRYGAVLATLVCEDLARIDPVQNVLRAVGPNLLIALLMDGPQLEKRWPGRYATVLADDPGCAVLTLTSLGMVKRSTAPGERIGREIALWKDPSGLARELVLPKKSHALVITVAQKKETNYSLDRRDDDNGTMGLSLVGIRDIRLRPVPEWIDG